MVWGETPWVPEAGSWLEQSKVVSLGRAGSEGGDCRVKWGGILGGGVSQWGHLGAEEAEGSHYPTPFWKPQSLFCLHFIGPNSLAVNWGNN